MKEKSVLIRILAIGGTILAWLPIIAPILLTIVFFFMEGRFLFDYLMPAELFLFFLIGGGLLLWASLRVRKWHLLIGCGYGAAIFFLVSGQALAVLTGLATGRTEPAGWQWILVLSSLALCYLSVIAVDVGGILLLSSIFKASRRQSVNT